MGVGWRVGVVGLLLAAVLGGSAQAAEVRRGELAAVIHRTEHGVAHVTADGDDGLGFGYGYVAAQDHLCLLAEAYVTVAGERSRFFGPDGYFVFHANGARHTNLDADFFYRSVNASGAFDRARAAEGAAALRPGVVELMRGYVAGYNRYLADVGGADGVRDPSCRGEPWVRPITEELAYARLGQLASLAGGGLASTGVARAEPPPPGAATAADGDRRGMLDELGERLGLGGLGSNAVALGRAGTASGRGMLLANPHLPWDGDYRLHHVRLRIPGELNASGAAFIGVPLVLIGHTRGLAWSHTTSSAFRFTPVELQLVPGSPTTYIVDGAPRAMTSREITVEYRREDGSLGSETRRLWSSEHGPILTELLGLPLFPWTPERAYAFADVNAENLRYLNHFYDVDRAQSIRGVERALHRHQGIPWANTVAADARGRVLYADQSAVPHVTDEKAAACNTELGVPAFAQLRLPVLDGSRSACGWGSDPDAVVPGIFGPGNLPQLVRTDYASNSNDSHWLANPREPLEGYARIIGDERTERSLRTRLGLRMIGEGLPFTLDSLMAMQFNDRQGAAELTRDALVAMCRDLPALPSSQGPVAPGEACDVLAAWDTRDALDSRGALLFRRWAERALKAPVPGANAVGGGPPRAGTWWDAFDPGRPVETPRRLNTGNPIVQQALGDAMLDLRGAGIPLDAPLGDFQFEMRGDERIPMHGGPGIVGTFNAMNVRWLARKGYPDVPHGATFILATELSGRCPPAYTLVAYSQSSDPTSPWYADMTRMLSRGEWMRERYCEHDVLRSPALEATVPACVPARVGTGRGRIAWLRPGMSERRGRRLLGPPRGPGRVRVWCVAGGGTVRALADSGGRFRLVVTTGRRHRVAGLRVGGRAPRAARSRVVVRRVGRRRVAVAGLRAKRVRWVALTGTRDARRAVRWARRAGVR